MDDLGNQDTAALEQVGLLIEPVRRRLYAFVAAQPEPIDRDTAAAAVGIGRPLAAFHLDRLAEAGLLSIEFRRRSGRSGPGAGRPAKFYRATPRDAVEVSLPPRRYALAAEIFAQGIEGGGGDEGDAVKEKVLGAAAAYGQRMAEDADDAEPGSSVRSGSAGLMTVLRGHGYSPESLADGGIRLRNCPFHALVPEHRGLTCATNLALLDAVAAGLPGSRLRAERQDIPGYCCVALVPTQVPTAG
jgi:predicted ArsR family transcriptional regulator